MTDIGFAALGCGLNESIKDAKYKVNTSITKYRYKIHFPKNYGHVKK